MRTIGRIKSIFRSTTEARPLALITALVCMFTFASAQTTVTVGYGTNNNNFVPVRTGQNYSYCQMIYYPINVGYAGSITKIRFWYNAGTNTQNSSNWGLYMGHTAQTSFTANSSSFIPLNQLTLVYNGAVNYPGPGNWLEITLATPFEYDGIQNLVIGLDENSPGASTGLSWGVFSVPSPSRSIGGESSTNIDPASPIRSFNDNSLARLQLVFAPLTDVTLEMHTPDASSEEISWSMVRTSTDLEVCSGGGYPPDISDPITAFCGLVDGCYNLRVFDSMGDGFGVGGGYQLRLSAGDPKDVRIIDNTDNFNSGSLSTISGGPNSFCLPMSTQKPLYQHRDRLDFVSNEYLVCEEDPAVSAQWQVGDQTLSGYQFWFFDPNGGYSYRRGRTHATSDNFGNVGATRACHMKINNWAVANQIPENVLMNVRIRTRVNGVYGEFGPAYRFKIDPVRAQCKLTKLLDFVESPYLSCNSTRSFGPNNRVHARTVTGANKYQFRFRIAAENFVVVRTSNTYFLDLNWTVDPLVAGKIYVVDVRASKDGGATWCAANGPQWGDLCNLTIAPGAQDGEQQMTLNNENSKLMLYPNPNLGDQLSLHVEGIAADVISVTVDIFDMTGNRIIARELRVQGDNLTTVMELNGDLAAGLYMVTVSAGTKTWNQRLVIAR